jgi:hypothetical protein
MAMIYQASAGVANAKKLTISMWCRAHTTNAPSLAGDFFQLLEFGDTSGPDGPSDYLSAISLATNTNGTNSSFYNNISLQLAGAKESVSGADVITYTGGTHVPGYDTRYYPKMPPQDFGTSTDGDYLQTRNYTPYFSASTKDLGALVAPGKWFHLFVSVDASNATSYGGTNAGMFIAVNGFTNPLYGPAGTSYDTWDVGTMQPAMLDTGVGSTTIFQNGPWHESRAANDLWGSIPAFDFAMNGFEIGIPSQRASPNKNTQLLDMADVQIWVDKFIDPTVLTNFEKLVDVVDGRGSPVNPDMAADYFGPQTYLFKGQREDFLVNNGAGGAFSYSGTITTSSGVGY